MSDDEIVAGPPGVNTADALVPDIKPKYRSWRKKYRKMKTRFDHVMKDSNQLFVDEQKLESLSKRLQEQNDQLMELLLDLNSTISIPHEMRFDIESLPPTQQEDDLTIDAANQMLADTYSRYRQGDESSSVRQDLDRMLARKKATKLTDLEESVPHPQSHPEHQMPASVLDAHPAFLSSAHRDEYLARLDVKLDPAPLSEPRPASPVPLSKLSQRELDREVELRNPLSVHNWLKKHGTVADVDTTSEGGAPAAHTPATAKKSRNLAKQVGDRAIERAREQREDGSPVSTQDLEDELAGDDTPGKKKNRDDDQTYRPKGGRSTKSKRKREDGENGGASRGKKPRTSNIAPAESS